MHNSYQVAVKPDAFYRHQNINSTILDIKILFYYYYFWFFCNKCRKYNLRLKALNLGKSFNFLFSSLSCVTVDGDSSIQAASSHGDLSLGGSWTLINWKSISSVGDCLGHVVHLACPIYKGGRHIHQNWC